MEINGFYYDPDKKRYFKISKSNPKPSITDEASVNYCRPKFCSDKTRKFLGVINSLPTPSIIHNEFLKPLSSSFVLSLQSSRNDDFFLSRPSKLTIKKVCHKSAGEYALVDYLHLDHINNPLHNIVTHKDSIGMVTANNGQLSFKIVTDFNVQDILLGKRMTESLCATMSNHFWAVGGSNGFFVGRNDEKRFFRLSSDVFSVESSNCHRDLWIGSRNGSIYVCDLKQGKVNFSCQRKGPIWSMHSSENTLYLGLDRTVELVDTRFIKTPVVVFGVDQGMNPFSDGIRRPTFCLSDDLRFLFKVDSKWKGLDVYCTNSCNPVVNIPFDHTVLSCNFFYPFSFESTLIDGLKAAVGIWTGLSGCRTGICSFES